MRFFAFILLLFLNLPVFGQQLEFSINIGSKEIGSITAQRDSKQNREVYNVVSDATFRVIWKYHRTTEMIVVYSNDTLESSLSKAKMNDDVKVHSEYWKDEQGYKCLELDKKAKKENVVLFSTVKLYFVEPEGIDSVYSETFLVMSHLEALGDHKYKLYLPGNRENTYSYLNGELQEVKVDRIIDILFKRKPNQE